MLENSPIGSYPSYLISHDSRICFSPYNFPDTGKTPCYNITSGKSYLSIFETVNGMGWLWWLLRGF